MRYGSTVVLSNYKGMIVIAYQGTWMPVFLKQKTNKKAKRKVVMLTSCPLSSLCPGGGRGDLIYCGGSCIMFEFLIMS